MSRRAAYWVFSLCFLFCLTANAEGSGRSQFTETHQLQKALAAIDASAEPDYTKRKANTRVTSEFYRQRALADAAYKDTLKLAADSWYEGSKRWRKIPKPVWDKLRAADQGRFREGVDPELAR